MNRINFFQLLELPINPPENRPEIISAAIKKKQSEWSRLRNHPTKGMQARQYINLLPEVRRIMQDPGLRAQEAQAATDEIKKKLQAKIEEIDEHIRLIGAKGMVTEADVQRLSKRHNIKAQLIKKRVKAWHDRKPPRIEEKLNNFMVGRETNDNDIPRIAKKLKADPNELLDAYQRIKTRRLEEIDAYIGIQVRKGYMTQNEISEISRLYGIAEGDVLRRVRVPVKKAGPRTEGSEQQLDETVEKVIEENLKAVDQSSLYSFLGLWPSSSLEALQKKAAEKETEIRRIAIKDAKVTASGTLAGHCLAVFKNDESRYAYDVSRARSLLKELSKDINLVEAAGKVDIPSYQCLIRKAAGFGTPPAEAREHIQNYCSEKNWKVDIPKFKKKRDLRSVYLGLSIGSVVVLIAIGVIWWREVQAERAHRTYQHLSDEVQAATSLEAKEKLLSEYISGNPKDFLSTQAQMTLNKIRRQIIERDYAKTQADADAAGKAKRYEDAREIYQQFLSKYPDVSFSEDIRSQMLKIPELIDQRDFETISAFDPKKDIFAVIQASENYLNRHPDGNHIAPVKRTISQLADAYYEYIQNGLSDCEASGNWRTCIDLTDQYIRVYKDNSRAIALRSARDRYRINLGNARILESLKEKAQSVGEDPRAVKQVYLDYLEGHPRTPARGVIEAELSGMKDSLDQLTVVNAEKKVRQRLPDAAKYYSEKIRGTLTDSRTRLVWTMVDSAIQTGQCLSHDDARGFVDAMDTGGFKDWRLPKPAELEALFSGSVRFPGEIEAEWLWTSESHRRYAGGWVTDVNVIFPNGDAAKTRHQKDARECGWVLAVRP